MLTEIVEPIKAEFEEFQRMYKQALSADNGILSGMISHIYASSGKQTRPMLLLLVSYINGGVTLKSLNAAIASELLHLASLIHDDVVDESDMRRGNPSIRAAYDNKLAVLGGDYVLTTAMQYALETDDIEVVKVINVLGKTLSSGEIMQYNNTRQALFDEAAYYDVIKNKTAALFFTCTKLGCITAAAADKAVTHILEQVGMLIGLCFQIKDDIFDYSLNPETGKVQCKDLIDGKITLPLIYVYNQAEADVKLQIADMVKQRDVEKLRDLAVERGGIAYAEQKLCSLRDEAFGLISSLTPSAGTNSLKAYINYIVERQK